ncbi:hypothetical protein RRG08_028641 [Elysia crispata]|uniref:Uncharacterized protein n=1 Tax=Elysia crispata TaxID=231223 RepID=A0AAE0YAU3_9GAST|nr:hypothetical protein RRG08_028641 [Elysia crispata]
MRSIPQTLPRSKQSNRVNPQIGKRRFARDRKKPQKSRKTPERVPDIHHCCLVTRVVTAQVRGHNHNIDHRPLAIEDRNFERILEGAD